MSYRQADGRTDRRGTVLLARPTVQSQRASKVHTRDLPKRDGVRECKKRLALNTARSQPQTKAINITRDQKKQLLEHGASCN